MQSKRTLAALSAFLVMGTAAISTAQTNSSSVNPTGNATSAGTPSVSPSPFGTTLQQGTPSATPMPGASQQSGPIGTPAPGADVTNNNGLVNPATNPNITNTSGTVPGGDVIYPGAGSTVNGAQGTTSPGQVTPIDLDFANRASVSGIMEVRTAKLATMTTNNPKVKAFAQMMLNAHGTMNSDLARIVSAKGMHLTASPSADQNSFYDRLSAQTGSTFDRNFMNSQVKMHQEALKLFNQAKDDATDQDLKNFFTIGANHVSQHLAQAKGIQAGL